LDIASKRTRRNMFMPAAAAGYVAVVALLAAHYALSAASNLAADAAIALAALPIAYIASTRGLVSGLAAVAVCALAPLDHVQDIANTTAEFAAVGFAAVAGLALGAAVSAEREESARLLWLIQARIGRLQGEPGYWHTIATTRNGLYVTGVEARFIRDALRQKPPGFVCDIGAGSGRLEFAIAPQANAVVATEVDDDELGRMAFDDRVTPIHVSAAPGLPFRDASLDWVIAVEVPAVSDEDWFVNECRRVLKPDGRAIVMVYNRRSYKGLVARLQESRRAAKGQAWAGLYYRLTLSEHLHRWQRAGFSAQRVEGFYWAPVGRGSDSPLVTLAAALERVFGLHWLAAFSPWVMVELHRDAVAARGD
jgi:SAM-dependent methyltransferase